MWERMEKIITPVAGLITIVAILIGGLWYLSNLDSRLTVLESLNIQTELENALATIETTKNGAISDFAESSDRSKSEIEKSINDAESEIKLLSPQVGTIISSMLTWLEFTSLDQDINQYWAPANGSPLPEGSLYGQLRNVDITPDLRGMFLRGLNDGRNDGLEDPDGDGRVPGSKQLDAFKSHHHTLILKRSDADDGGGMFSSGNRPPFPDANIPSSPTGHLETRPKNVAVHYYIRIN